MSKPRLIIIGAVFVVVILVVLLFTGVIPGVRTQTPPPTPLTVWGVFDSPELFQSVAAAVGPQYAVSFRSFNVQTYETDLVNALAAGKGPDIFMMHSSWLPEHFDKVVPLPNTQLSLANLRTLFPTVVEQDFAPSGTAYALPLYIDTLALLYNREHFDNANIPFPPKTWDEFQSFVPQLRTLDASGKITRAAAAIGGSNKNITRASDILSAIMLQAGVQMVSPDFAQATFANKGRDALSFYTKFANPANTYYTWNDNFKHAIDGFADGSVSMLLTYAYQLPAIREKNPFLKVGVAPFPQLTGAEQKVTYANYWGLAVSNRSRKPQAAWNFVLGFTANPSVALQYAKTTGRVPALRSLLANVTDAELAVFANQVLTARSWSQPDSVGVENAFSGMISAVLSGQASVEKALQQAQDAVTLLMQKNAQRL